MEVADVQDFEQLRRAVRGVGKVYHFAAQVAVTTSLSSPFHDFEVNARGTLNFLEALRELREPPPLLFTSTNKVYGSLNDVRLQLAAVAYEPEEATFGCGASMNRAAWTSIAHMVAQKAPRNNTCSTTPVPSGCGRPFSG